MSRVKSQLLVALMLCSCFPAATAQEVPLGVPSAGALDIVDEVRVGLSYHMVYWTMIPVNPQDWYLDRLEDVTFDVLFTSPDLDAFRWIGQPRPEVGATINVKGEDSHLHFGLTWQAHLFDTPLYVEGTFGGALHSGYLGDEAPAGRRKYGCQVNFYERVGIGIDLSESATATLAYEHISNAGLCGYNDGLSNIGLKLGWKF